MCMHLIFHVRNHQERLTQAPPTVTTRNVLFCARNYILTLGNPTSHYMWVDSASVGVYRRELRRANAILRSYHGINPLPNVLGLLN